MSDNTFGQQNSRLIKDLEIAIRISTDDTLAVKIANCLQGASILDAQRALLCVYGQLFQYKVNTEIE